MATEEYVEMDWCGGHCKRETQQRFSSAGHERDSSYDHTECLECRWWKMGMTGSQWHPPIGDSDGK